MGGSYYSFTKEEKDLISKWIGKKPTENSLSYYIFYKYNGEIAADFHKICDRQNDTLTLIITEDGKKLGGYVNTLWTNLNEGRKDPKAFLFNLNKKVKYPIKKDKIAISCNNDKGPDFIDLNICNKCFTEKHSFFKFDETSNYDIPDKDYASGNQFFLVKEIYVFKLIFENE